MQVPTTMPKAGLHRRFPESPFTPYLLRGTSCQYGVNHTVSFTHFFRRNTKNSVKCAMNHCLGGTSKNYPLFWDPNLPTIEKHQETAQPHLCLRDWLASSPKYLATCRETQGFLCCQTEANCCTYYMYLVCIYIYIIGLRVYPVGLAHLIF